MESSPQLLIAICTYNEIDNLPWLYERLRARFNDATLLIVDDGSPDGTGQWCDGIATTDQYFRVLHRGKKSGLGSASIVAFEYAIEHGFQCVLTMDGDRSHDPSDSQNVVRKLLASNEHDISIGSRYVNGGGITGWPWHRHVMSRCINLFSRVMLGLQVRDCSSAFRCYRVRLLERIDFSTIQGTGYAYLEEILWRAKQLNAVIVEQPITFNNRSEGVSKINLREAYRAVWIIFKIGCSRPLQHNPTP